VKKICFVTTTPLIVNFFLRGQLAALGRYYDVTLVVNTDDRSFLSDTGMSVTVVPLTIERQISLFRDLLALIRLTALFASQRFASVHSVSPKAGLLVMVAASIARIPVRIHVFQGEVWVTRKGVFRRLLKYLDWLVARLATHVLVVSRSERDFLIREGVIRDASSKVLGDGSINGVDVKRFRPDPSVRAEIRRLLGIRERDFFILFLGRLTLDKGVLDLARAFVQLATTRREAHLVLVGPDEDHLRGAVEELCARCSGRVHVVDLTYTPERYLAAADVLCLPSLREGFPNAIIEAAATGVPAVGSRIYGITDAIIEGETGLLHTPADANDLAEKMEMLLKDPALRERLGARARQRAVAEFSQQRLTQALLDYYRGALGE
jgi:glycosyltransferase involved in cell wall biosynthesis